MRIAVALWSVLALASAAKAKELWERSWIGVRTPHFQVASAFGEEETVELAVQLENFRRVVGWVTNLERLDERVPMRVLLVPVVAPEIGMEAHRAGFLLPTMRVNYAVGRPAGKSSPSVLLHEYVHFLLRNHADLLYPTWYDEGFAEFLSTVEVRDRRFTYGRPSENRALWLAGAPWLTGVTNAGPWLGFERILRARSTAAFVGSAQAQFYAQSWALVHFLVLGREGADFGADMTKFLRSREAGTDDVAAFEAAFGISVSGLERHIRRHLARHGGIRGVLKDPFPRAEVSIRSLRANEVAVQLGLVAFALGNVEDAQRSFEAALAASPDDGAAMVGLADVHKVAGRFTEAEALYEKAIALAPDNALHELDFGEYCETRAKAETDPAKRREWLRAARRHYVRSHALDPETPETLWAYGQTFLVDGEPPEKGLEALAEAHARLPASPPIKLAYARVLARVGRRDEARAQLRRLLAWSHAELAAEAEQLLAELDAKPLEQATPSQ